MPKILVRYSLPFASLLLLLAVWLFWWLGYPHVLSYHEQNQLFLFTNDYLCRDLCQAGGLADYLSEFIVQFFYVPCLGAFVLALLMVAIQHLTYRHMGSRLFGLSLLPVALLTLAYGDIDMLMSYAVAVALAMAAAFVPAGRRWWQTLLVQLVMVPAIYWLVGPLVWLYALLFIVRNGYRHAYVLLLCAGVQAVMYEYVLLQWPLEHVCLGLNYYRTRLTFPTMIWLMPMLTVVVIAVLRHEKVAQMLDGSTKKVVLMNGIATAAVAVMLFLCFDKSYDKDTLALIRQDYLIRNERWQDIITEADSYTVQTSFWSNSVNLALAMTKQMPERQFNYYQSGPDALIMMPMRDNMSNAPAMETFYRLGLVNESMRYAFDLQESILNGKKSGRFTKRIAECCIINGKYDVARKYLNILRSTIFYRTWAEDAKRCLGNDRMVARHEEWGRMRRLRLKKDYLYQYAEIEKTFENLYLQDNTNRLALEYFLSQNLLAGKFDDFMQHLALLKQSGFYSSMPASYADAYQCLEQKNILPGSAFGEYIKHMTQSSQELQNNEMSAH